MTKELTICAHADVRPEHYRFPRQQAIYTPRLQRTPPLVSLGRIIFGTFCLAAMIFGAMALVGLAGTWLAANRWIAPAW